MAGKGDTPRPVDLKKYQENYSYIFGDKEDNFFALGDIVKNGCGDKLDESSNIQTTTGES